MMNQEKEIEENKLLRRENFIRLKKRCPICKTRGFETNYYVQEGGFCVKCDIWVVPYSSRNGIFKSRLCKPDLDIQFHVNGKPKITWKEWFNQKEWDKIVLDKKQKEEQYRISRLPILNQERWRCIVSSNSKHGKLSRQLEVYQSVLRCDWATRDAYLIANLNIRKIEMLLPIIQINYQKQKTRTAFGALRHLVFQRDNYKCVECGATKEELRLEVDHIIPWSKGGLTELPNLQTLCKKCNRSKHARIWDDKNE